MFDMKQILVHLDDVTAKLLHKYAPGRGRKRSKFIREAVLRALMDVVEEETRRAYERLGPPEDTWYFDPEAWAPDSEAYKPNAREKREIERARSGRSTEKPRREPPQGEPARRQPARTPGNDDEAVRDLVADLPKPAGPRPVLLMSRDLAHRYLGRIIVAEVTSRVYVIPQEVSLGSSEGLKAGSVARLDNLQTVPIELLRKKLGKLAKSREREVKHALGYVLGWHELVMLGST